MDLKEKNIAIIGLGVMGGSFMLGMLKNKLKLTVHDIDTNLLKFIEENYEVAVEENHLNALAVADLTIVALNPKASCDFIINNAGNFKKGSVVMDITGVKNGFIDEIVNKLPKDVYFVSTHPMAGRESKGFYMADGEIFENCNFLIINHERLQKHEAEVVGTLANLLKVKKILFTNVQKHDEYIAYTSQLPHVISIAYAGAKGKRNVLSYAANSYADISRISDINAPMWAELFLENKQNLLNEIDNMTANLTSLRELVALGNEEALAEYLSGAHKKD